MKAATMKADLDANGWPIVPHPEIANSLIKQVTKFCLINIVFGLIVPLFVMAKMVKGQIKWSDLAKIYKFVTEAQSSPINKLPEYQGKDLIRQLWGTDSARPYIDGDALEYQMREGYCNSATMRCTLKSFPSYPRDKIPPQKSEPADPKKWQGMNAWGVDDDADGEENKNDGDDNKKTPNLEILPGSCSYTEFLSAIKRGVEDSSCRIVLNYLRPALFGFAAPWWLPANFCLGLLGGHFSPIVGMIETEKYKGDNPLIGVFDVNHKYGGAYLVPAKTLFRSVLLMDLSTQQPRAIILVNEPKNSNLMKGVR